ncbi:hypothetical protein GE061_005567 [Apolygus lucorum]|uniref:DUF4485 domain-containing protein n=1 Tax=Apolygus lucorum TaxID=248454 RepID=A0A8S9WW02_APOLU|nr:hypothetical protein GE061_005567 [Apolygus lucorum]
MASKKGGSKPVKQTKSDPPVTTSRDDASEAKRKQQGAKGGAKKKDDNEGNQKGECKSPWDNIGHDSGDANKFPRFSSERLDQDFFQFATQAHGAMKKGQLSRKHEDIASRWLAKLLTEQYPDLVSKKNRNIYLSNLLLQVADGALSGPLLKAPAQGPLPNAAAAFQLSAPPDRSRLDNAKDIMLNPKDYLHTSTEGRTYLATKNLEGDVGVCAFIGVSVGGDEPKWIKPTGEATCVPERDDLMVTKIEGMGDRAIFRGIDPGNSIHSIAARRKSKSERESLIAFYQMVLSKVKDAMQNVNVDYDGPNDPLLDKLIHNIQCEQIQCGVTDSSSCTYSSLLHTLERKITFLLDSALNRDKEIERIQKQTNVTDNEAKLVDLSSMKAFDPADDIWKAAITEEPNETTLANLKYHYPSCIVTTLLMLLERQRQIIIDQEKKTHEQLVASMRAELMFDVKDSVVKYQEAQRILNRMMKALKQAERINQERKSMITQDSAIQAPQSADNVASFTKDLMMKKQVIEAQRKLEMARQNAVHIDNKMDELNCKIADVQKRNIEANEALKNDAIRWSKIVCQMKADLKAQEKEIERLTKLLETLQTQTDCCLY